LENHRWFMSQALELAEKAYYQDEVPVGAVITYRTGEVIAQAYNTKEQTRNPCAHAEILAIEQASKYLDNWRLSDCTLYVSLEPCPMCLGALVQARIKKLVFGAYDFKGGAISLGYNLFNDKRLNHNLKVVGGVMHFECSRMISNFFREKRSKYQKDLSFSNK
jgi:tRNA(adenine34) deaminase